MLLVNSEASIYDDDYDAYTRTYDYKNAGNLDVFPFDNQSVYLLMELATIDNMYQHQS